MRNHVIEPARQVRSMELDPDLLISLPNGGGQQVFFGRLSTTSGEGHVAGPRISDPLSSADEEDGLGIGCEDDCDRGPDQRRILVAGGITWGQAVSEVTEPPGQWG